MRHRRSLVKCRRSLVRRCRSLFLIGSCFVVIGPQKIPHIISYILVPNAFSCILVGFGDSCVEKRDVPLSTTFMLLRTN